MPAAVVTVWFDHACPHSYNALMQLGELASDRGFEMDRRPFLARSELESNRYHTMALAQHEAALKAGIVRTPTFQTGGKLHSGTIATGELREAVQSAR